MEAETMQYVSKARCRQLEIDIINNIIDVIDNGSLQFGTFERYNNYAVSITVMSNEERKAVAYNKNNFICLYYHERLIKHDCMNTVKDKTVSCCPFYGCGNSDSKDVYSILNSTRFMYMGKSKKLFLLRSMLNSIYSWR